MNIEEFMNDHEIISAIIIGCIFLLSIFVIVAIATAIQDCRWKNIPIQERKAELITILTTGKYGETTETVWNVDGFGRVQTDDEEIFKSASKSTIFKVQISGKKINIIGVKEDGGSK